MSEKIMNALGVIKWFSNLKGIGFIRPDNGEIDILVHYSSLNDSNTSQLAEGDRVMFDLIPHIAGLEAENVRRVDEQK